MEENMANILVSGLINTETTVRVRQFITQLITLFSG